MGGFYLAFCLSLANKEMNEGRIEIHFIIIITKFVKII